MKFLSVIILIFRIKIALPQHWVSRHRRKALDGSLTPEETLFLESVRPLFDEEEWNEWMIDAALELPETDDEVRRAQTEKMLTDAKSLASAANAKVRKPLFRWSTRGIAACVAVFVLGFLYYIYNPHFVLDDFQRCRDVDPDAELALSSEPARLSYGTGAELEYTPFAMGHVPGDSVQQGHVVIRLVERGHYAISVQDQIDTLMAEHVEPSQRIRFETGAYQHIQVSLPDGTTVRMDAGSRLDYRMIFPDSAADLSQSREWIFLDGQALLKIPEHDAHSALVVQTIHGWLEARPGQYVLRVTQDEVRATILSGNMLLNAHTEPGNRVLAKSGTQVRLCLICNKEQKIENLWTTDRLNQAKIAQSLTWTKAMRRYRKVPMREFVSDMARWYGIEFEDINCISANRHHRDRTSDVLQFMYFCHGHWPRSLSSLGTSSSYFVC